MEPQPRPDNCSNVSKTMSRYGVYIDNHLHGPRHESHRHSHSFHSLYYITSGHGSCSIDARAYALVPDTAVVLPANVRHEFVDAAGKPMTVLVIYFDKEQAQRNQEVLSIACDPLPVRFAAHRAEHIRRLLRRMLHEQDHQESCCGFALQTCLSSILLEFCRQYVKVSQEGMQLDNSSLARVRHVLDHVAERYYEAQSLSAAARMAHVSVRQFSNLCRKLVDQSFIQYVHNIRITKAGQLLWQSDMPITAVAFETGFEDLSTFYRAFKRHYRCSPKRYRQQSRDASGDQFA